MEETTKDNQRFEIKKSEPVLVQAIDTENSNNQDYFLSNLDLNIADTLKIIYCYKSTDHKSTKNVATVIKEALGKVLSHYYPLAGILMVGDDGKFVVKCSNKGAVFVEADADCEIDVLGDSKVPDLALSGNLLHHQETSILNLPLLSVQVTRFKCGGFVVGTVINHLMVDGGSVIDFMTSWGETARELPITNPPYLDRRVLESRKPPLIKYPHTEYDGIEDISGIEDYYQSEKIVREAITFDLDKVNILKNKIMQDGDIESCTNFTILTALVWKSRCKALKFKPDQIAKLYFYIDPRFKPDYTLPKGYFGVTVHNVSCTCLAGDLMEKPLSFAVEVMQKCMEKVTWDYVKSVNDYLEVNRYDAKVDFTTTLFVNSWRNISFHAVDFGWGEAYKTACLNKPAKEYYLFLPRGDDKSSQISVLVSLPETAMETFKTLVQL